MTTERAVAFFEAAVRGLTLRLKNSVDTLTKMGYEPEENELWRGKHSTASITTQFTHDLPGAKPAFVLKFTSTAPESFRAAFRASSRSVPSNKQSKQR